MAPSKAFAAPRARIPERSFHSADRRFALVMPGTVMAVIRRLCQCARRLETGGVLIGRYSAKSDSAIVDAASGRPPDSRASSHHFERGVSGLQAWLDRRNARRGSHYLGEWHFHPHASPQPSSIDRNQLRAISKAPQYRCPQPVLLILGGDPHAEWKVSVSVFPAGKAEVQLYERILGAGGASKQ